MATDIRLGDLLLTCTGSQSRNHRLGLAVAGGQTLVQAEASTPMVAEGVRTVASARMLAGRAGVSMPICDEVSAVLFEAKPVKEALVSLLAWRLDLDHVDPVSSVERISSGNPRYPAGTAVTLRAISGHRDAYPTSCPGASLYAQLPVIRAEVAQTGLPKLYSPTVSGVLGGSLRFQARVWNLVKMASTCGECSRGCSTTVAAAPSLSSACSTRVRCSSAAAATSSTASPNDLKSVSSSPDRRPGFTPVMTSPSSA